MEAVLLIGIPGAGKTTWYRERFFETHLRLSRDMLRTRRRQEILLRACLAARQPFVIDNTNLAAAERARFIAPARAAGFRVVGYFFEPDPRGSVKRNEQRSGRGRVPPVAVFSMLKRLEPPSRSEGFDELHRVRIAEAGGFELDPSPEGAQT